MKIATSTFNRKPLPCPAFADRRASAPWRASALFPGSLPRYLAAILRNSVAGRQVFELRHTGFEGLDSKIEKGVNRLTGGADHHGLNSIFRSGRL